MANFVFTEAKHQLLQGTLNFVTDDIRVALLMTNSNAGSTEDAVTIGGIATLDEFDGAGYASGGVALAGKAVNKDNANDRSEFDATDVVFSSLGAGARQIQAALVYKFITSLGASLPIAYIDTGGFPVAANGGDVTIQWNPEGILQGT